MNLAIIRFFDIAISGIAIMLLLPLHLFIAIWILLDSRGPVFFRQPRIGRDGKTFILLKYRSMYQKSDLAGLLTIGDDKRVTRPGRFIRKYKIDELPQLLNVLCGTMSIVGPRPEVKKYVDLYTQNQRQILMVRPGITDFASIKYSNESDLLKIQSDPETFYMNYLIPEKIKLNMIFIEEPSVRLYLRIIFLTMKKILF
jgi:lipopolysaccharide/colanic/teichoic acid biosynthesis glycosyltransferase